MVERIEATPTTSRPAATVILMIFAAVAGTCIFLPTKSFLELISQISSEENTVLINKGVFYLLGVGVALSFLLVDGVYNSLMRRPIPKKIRKFVSAITFFGLGLVLMLPAAVHYISALVLEQRGYAVCDSASTQWLFVRDIVYTTPGICD